MDTLGSILDAATELLSTYGVKRVTLQDVADEAGVSRQTVYRHFGDRDGLLVAVVERQRDRFLADVVAAGDACADVRASIRGLIAETLRLATAHPVLSRLRSSDPELFLPLLASSSGIVRPVAVPALVDVLARHDIAVTADSADAVVRLLLSYVVDPTDEDPADLAEALTALVYDGLVSSASPLRKVS
ncbi:MAG: TetR/AcrR family transcriptional regulator [Acidimicrobiales bacterium]|nr:TetR/AcrR family transcriptional regulator [Acidimicrobiales bacterium]